MAWLPLALYDQVHDRKEHNDRQGADQQHVPYIVPGHRRARLGGAFRNSTVFDLRHVLLQRSPVLPGPTRCGNGCSVHLPPQDANVECADYLPRERYAVKTFFLGIFTHHRKGIWNLCGK
jgi:hypothetical protein